MIPPQQHQDVSHDDPVNRAGNHLLQHAGAAQLMNVTGKEIQDNEDPKDRQKDAGITIFVFHFKFPFVVLSAA